MLGQLAETAAANPTLIMVVDHCGGAIGPFCLAQGGPAKNIEWETGIARLAALPNVYMKVGGLQMSVNGFHVGREARPAPFAGGDAVQPRPIPVSSEELADMTYAIYSTVIRAFGPARCMFESNFPVDKFGVSYRVLWNCFKRISDRMALPTEARDQLFFGTANAVYQLGL